MRRAIIPAVVIAIAVTAYVFRDRWLPPTPGKGNYLGYVEGETTLVGSPVAGRIATVNVAKGQKVATGDRLFNLDTTQQDAEVARLEAAVATAVAQRRNLDTGKRNAEQDVVRAQRREVEAALTLAEAELKRATDLAHTGTAALARRDAAQSQMKQLEARLDQIDATLAVGELGGREADMAAATSRIAEARAALSQASARLADLAPKAPRPSLVEDVFFDEGEWVQAGQPVISLLDPSRITLRFFVPEQAMARLHAGAAIRFTCDGCGGPHAAQVTSISSQPEYTPPVIYSQSARAKLVFLVEAKPDDMSATMRPGLPIEVEPLP